jgi:hypothetical protein
MAGSSSPDEGLSADRRESGQEKASLPQQCESSNGGATRHAWMLSVLVLSFRERADGLSTRPERAAQQARIGHEVGRPVPAIPHGIANADGGTGFVALGGDQVVAVNLTSGSVRWRQAGAGRPLIVTGAGLVVLQRRDEQLRLALLDPDSGALLRQIAPLPVPDWAVAEWDRPEGFVAVAREQAEQPVIAWRARRLYRGGAAPPDAVARAARADAGGLVRIDPAQGSIEILPDPGGAEPTVESIAALGSRAAVETNVDGRLYTLRTTPTSAGTTSVALEAHDGSGGQPLWRTVVEEQVSRRPPPLRQ